MNDSTSNQGDDPNATDVAPVAIERQGNAIVITWSDQSVTNWSAKELRDACPCATCREKKKSQTPTEPASSPALPILSAAEARPLRIDAMQPVGSYAYSISFSDGHSSGIFPFALLRRS